MEIGFSGRYLIDMLNALDAKEILLSMSEFNRPGVLTPSEQAEGEGSTDAGDADRAQLLKYCFKVSGWADAIE